MLINTTKSEIIICPRCEGTGKARFRTDEDGTFYGHCPDCNGKGRVKKITKINYEKI